MVVDLIHFLKIWVVVGESVKLFFAQSEIVELIFEDDAGVEESVADDVVTFSLLLFLKGDLCKVILPFVRVVLRTVLDGGKRVLCGLYSGERVAHSLGHVVEVVCVEVADNGLVDALPVVHILSFSPKFLESAFTL